MDRTYRDWMWSEACAILIQADRLHNRIFRPAPYSRTGPAWEPPVDILETDGEVLVFVALPGVDPQRIETVIDGGDLVVSGARILPSTLRTAAIHRLELPQGQFERRVRLPAGKYKGIHRSMVNGCVLVTLEKTGVSYG